MPILKRKSFIHSGQSLTAVIKIAIFTLHSIYIFIPNRNRYLVMIL